MTQNLYGDLITNIQELLVKEKDSRGEASTALRTIRLTYDSIESHAVSGY